MKNLLLAAVAVVGLAGCAHQYTPEQRAKLDTCVETNLPDNQEQLITPAHLRRAITCTAQYSDGTL